MDAVLLLIVLPCVILVCFGAYYWRGCMDAAYVRGYKAALKAQGVRALVPNREPRRPDDPGFA